jgi:hypothetical protein
MIYPIANICLDKRISMNRQENSSDYVEERLKILFTGLSIIQKKEGCYF